MKIDIVKAPGVDLEINMVDDAYCSRENVYLVPNGVKLVNCVEMKKYDELVVENRKLKRSNLSLKIYLASAYAASILAVLYKVLR